uniref:Esterase, PHB depolymerase family n=1 Tax=Candidatus Kentrum sp. TUN TaxID=2126343 RepID=A0A451AP61_9GAMM|nr:MAG: esterase, PHB depolymerase family [Candidatus Kentron sp. TUN]VFK67843.1 MAG: esterase, PHB depolymerase family [Candidatus Kentron sp. TUN]
MPGGLRRYEFSEQLAGILGESRRDLRFRVTMMVSGGVMEPGPRGRGSPLATPAYGTNLLIGTMAAPQQVHTVEAIRCYRELAPVAIPETTAPSVVVGSPAIRTTTSASTTLPLPLEQLRFGECLTELLELALFDTTREILANELFGIWVNRSCPVAALQIGMWSKGQRSIITQRFELPDGGHLPAWLDPGRGGTADPGLFHTVFLPVDKLIEIGMLTTSKKQKGIPMLNLGLKMTKFTDIVNLVRQGDQRHQWEEMLSALAKVQAWTNKVGAQDSRLVEVTDFGSNPGNLRMFSYVPRHLPVGAPLVVALHGCTQTATAYDQGSGWSQLADRFGFSLLLPQQHWHNNPLRCFNWFRPEDTTRDSGESLSIRQMVERMLLDHDLDGRHVYVTGLSSGGAMSSVMLATYPDIFAGGAIVAGVPYHAADDLQGAFEAMFTGRCLMAREWGDRVRAASSHQGPWPRISVWHGDADASVTPVNAEEIIKQWIDTHGLSLMPTVENHVDGYPHRIWQSPQGQNLIESYTITGMSHGQPLDIDGEEHSYGTAAPFFNDVGISSTYRIAEFWGLGLSEAMSREGIKPEDKTEVEQTITVIPTPTSTDSGSWSEKNASPDETDASANSQGNTGKAHTKRTSAPLGIDVQEIITKSLGIAGILKGTGEAPGSTGSKSTQNSDLFGIDVQGIINKSLDMAGSLAESYRTPSEIDEEGKSQWQGEGWELISHSANTSATEPLLFGYASSGNDCDTGNKVRSISRQVLLGQHPSLSYIRRLNLNASVNNYTKARFSVLVDGLPVDEVSAIGMKHTETEWTQRSGIDLAPFADRKVTLTFEVSAHSNVCNEVFAKAWVDRIHVRDVITVNGKN